MKKLVLSLVLSATPLTAFAEPINHQDAAQCAGFLAVAGPQSRWHKEGAINDWALAVAGDDTLDYETNKVLALAYADELDTLTRAVVKNYSVENTEKMHIVFEKGWNSCKALGLRQFNNIKTLQETK